LPAGADGTGKGMSALIDNPPAKLTLASLKSFIYKSKSEGLVAPIWNGKPCKDEDCAEGFKREIIDGNSYLFKCEKCKSISLKFIEYHSPQAVLNLQMKLKHINEGIDSGEQKFLSGRLT